MNLAQALENSADKFPDNCAIISGGLKTSYADLDAEAGRVASGIIKLGAGPGDHIGICLPNVAQWPAIYFGILKAGCVAVTLFHGLTKSELSQILNDSQPKIFFTFEENLKAIPREDLPFMENVVSDGGDYTYNQLLEMGRSDFRSIDMKPNDPAVITYTGGTTGQPKGVVLSHENILSSLKNVAEQERSDETDIALCFLPMNHVFGQLHIMAATVYSSGSVVLLPGFDLDAVLSAIEKYKITKFFAVPTIYVRLLSLPDLGEKIGSIRYSFSAAASMARELVLEWKQKTGLDISESYGMTETAAMVTFNHFEKHVVGSVGTIVGEVEVFILSDDGSKAATGQPGEICIRGPNVMKKYLNKPEETKAAFHDGWIKSGDVGLFDEAGYLYIVDRIKDMIITGGENVYPREVEEELYTYPGVEECSVIGLSHREYGEAVTAVIVPKPGIKIDSASLKSFLKTKLSSFKVPKNYIFADSLPKSGAGKVLKRELKKTIEGGFE